MVNEIDGDQEHFWSPSPTKYMELTYCAILTELTMCWFDSGRVMTMQDYIELMWKAEYEHAKGNGWIKNQSSHVSTVINDSISQKQDIRDSRQPHIDVRHVNEHGISSKIQDTSSSHRGHILENGSQKAAAISLDVQTVLKGI